MQFLKSKHFWLGFLLALLTLTLILSISFIFNIRKLYKTGELKPSRGLHRNYLSGQMPDPAQIEGWMTFSYVNYIFKLPSDYLSKSLALTGNHYSNWGISQYAKAQKIDLAVFLKKVQASVVQYIKNPQ